MQIIVLGMHRSGTSSVARILNMMGAYFAPETVAMPPNAANPKGYWERTDVVLLNEGIFANLGATWNRVSGFDLANVSDNLRQEFDSQAKKIIFSLDAHRPWMLKDPRLCLTLPLWLPLLEIPVCVYVYRNPIQVAQSLKNRDGFPIHFGMALWEKYNLAALHYSASLPRILISYHDLMSNPVDTVHSFYRQLVQVCEVQGLRLPSDKEILSFIEPTLFHARDDANRQQSYITHHQMQLVDALENGTIFELETLPTLSEGSIEVLQTFDNYVLERDESFIALEKSKQALAQQEIDFKRSFQATIEEQQANHQAALESVYKQLEEKQTQFTEELQIKESERVKYWQEWLAAQERELQYQEDLQDAQQDLSRFKRELESLEAELGEKQQELLRLLDENQAHYNGIHKLTHWLEVLNHDLIAVFNSRTWRTGDAITQLALKLMFKSPGLTARDHIQKVLDEFFYWRIHEMSLDQSTRREEYLPFSGVDKKKPQIAALVALHNGEPSASASIRLIQPLTHPSVREEVDLQVYASLEYLFSLKPQLIVVQRHMVPTVPVAQRLIQHCRQQNIRLVYEIDDDLYNIFKKRDIHGGYPKEALEALTVITQQADRVITSSELLKKQISQLNSHVVCVPNVLDERLWLEQRQGRFVQPQAKVSGDIINILYMGTKTHTEDLKIVKKAYQKLKEVYGKRVVLEIVGGVPDGTDIFAEVVEVNTVNISTDNLDDYERFVHWIRQNNRWHFGIIPLQINDFNLKKTYIKFLDYSALGLASICTDMAVYREVIRQGENGLLVSNETQAWYEAMVRLIEEVDFREKLAKNAFNDLTEKYILQHTAKQFLRAYLDVLDSPKIPQQRLATPNRTPPNLSPVAPPHLKNETYQDYQRWIRSYDSLDKKTLQRMYQRIKTWQSSPLISIIMPTYNIEEKWLRAAIESVRNQIYPQWELCIVDDASTLPSVRPLLEKFANQDKRIKVHFRATNGHISAASNDALTLAQGQYVALLDHDDLLALHALYWVIEEILAHPDAMLIYSDEDKINDNNERSGAYFKCDWNPDLFLSHNLITHLAVYRTDLLREIGGFRIGFEGAQDYDLALRAIEHINATQIHHIPRILYHWRMLETSTSGNPNAKPYAIKAAQRAISEHLARQGITARVSESLTMSGMLRVQYGLPSHPPLVSLIIPTHNQVKLLKRCVESILNKTDYQPYEILIVDNRSNDPLTLAYLRELQDKSLARVIHYPHPFNFAAINNAAVEQAQGTIIGFLNNDLEVINRDWLSEMVSHAVRPEIGAVGARLWYPHNALQHGGVLLGVGGVAEHAHKGLARGKDGYFGRAQVIQNFSAVTAACMLVRKEAFLQVGGFNAEHLAVAYNDIDMCLKLATQGLRTVWTPYAELYHHESATRGYDDTPEKRARLAQETAYMEQHWSDWLRNDPAYSPNLNISSGDFTLAWPPRVPTDKSMLTVKLPGFLKKLSRIGRKKSGDILAHRLEGYEFLQGHGLEIGALHEPAQLPTRCTVEYCDAHSREELLQLFPELVGKTLVEVNHICDLDTQGLSPFHEEQFDFIIFNHVVEHIANPIKIIGELFRVTKKGGCVTIAAPDKEYTFDKPRPLTTFAHLLAEHQVDVNKVTDAHYEEFLHYVHPEHPALGSAEMQKYLPRVKSRREHAHVWNTKSFKVFLKKTFDVLNLNPTCLFENEGHENHFEYFSIWRK